MSGQLRIAAGMDGIRVIGWDMNAALSLAKALGVNSAVAAECLPEIEAVMVRKLNEQLAAERG